MPFAVRFVRRRCTQQKKHKGLRQGGCANLRRKMACRLCFALPRCAHVKKTEGRSAARQYALRPLALAKWRQHLPRGFCAELLGGDIFCHYGERPRPFCPDGVAQFEQCARGRGRHVRTASRQSAACNNAPAFAVLFADAATIQTIRLLRRLRVLSVRRGNVIMIRARVFIYISILF